MLQVFYLNVAYVLHIYCKCMFRIFYLLHTYVVLKCFYVASVSYFRGTFRESWGTARAQREGARRAEDRQMGHTARLGSCRWGVLVLIQAPGPHPRGERMGSRGRSGGRSQGACVGRGEADGSRVHVWGWAR